MDADRGARKSRAALAGIVGESDDKVKILVGEVLPGVCHRAGGIYFEVFAENLQDQGVDFASRNFSSAVNFKAVAAHRSEQELGEDAALGVAGA